MNYEETLSTLKAIQASYAPVPFLANPETEPRFVIDSDERTITIPEEFKFLAVKMDHLSERIYFDIPRYFDGEDLATKICVVQYINANSDEAVEGIAAIVDVDYTSESGKIIFRWDVDNNVTKYAGDVSFSVRFYTISDDNRFTYSWNTVPATLPILDTIDNTGRTVTENYPTELLQWQYRMSELDRTISEKIEKASASIDADTKAAQAARKGAEDAEARVNAIVAGNEAYTKQQSHDLFALALKGTAEAAKSITIYPDKGSNVVATINGFTKQEGSGDASTVNVRAITCGGKILYCDTFDGSEDETWTNGGSDGRVAIVLSHKPKAYSSFYATKFRIYSITGAGGAYLDNKRLYVNPTGGQFSEEYPGITNANKLTEWPKRLKNKPFTIWYIADDGTGSLYTPLTKSSENDTAICAKLTAPLCQGDKLITKVKSGCDKSIVLDGSSDEGWRAFENGFAIYTVFGDSVPMDSRVVNKNVFCDRLFQHARGTSSTQKNPTGSFSPSSGSQYGGNWLVVNTGITELEAFKADLAANPITVRYRSTSYTEAKDIAVSLETHQQAVLVLDGTESFALHNVSSYGISNYTVKTTRSNIKSSGGGICSHFKSALLSYATNNKNNAICLFSDGNLAIASSDYESEDTLKSTIAEQYAAGTPVTIVYELATPITYAHDPVDFIASPDDEGAWVITGEANGTVSAEYNKNITKALENILTRVSALELHALGG